VRPCNAFILLTCLHTKVCRADADLEEKVFSFLLCDSKKRFEKTPFKKHVQNNRGCKTDKLIGKQRNYLPLLEFANVFGGCGRDYTNTSKVNVQMSAYKQRSANANAGQRSKEICRKTAGTASSLTELQFDVAGTSSRSAGTPLEVSGTSSDMTEFPIDAMRMSSKSAGTPLEVAGTSSGMTELPIDTTGTEFRVNNIPFVTINTEIIR